MNYTLHQLQVFLKVIECQSITKASEKLFMTQPAVSIQLKKFQDQFEIPLTEVIGRQLNVTSFGLEIAELAKKIMSEVDQIKYKTEAYKGLLTGKLSISSASTGKYVIPYFLTGFIERHPGIDLVLDVTNKMTVMESLQNNVTDFALISVVPDGYHLHEEVLIDNLLYLVGNKPKKEKSKPLIYREEGSATRQAMESYFSTQDQKLRKQVELTSNEAVKQAVIAGLGNSIMPLIGIHNELDTGQIHILKSKGLPIKTEWRIVWRKDKKLSPVSEAFLEHLRDGKEAIIQQHFSWLQEHL
tara:strand:- start:220 stop:1116 length:897 start_codon:yes stop_codon:yes gene_type:complete